MQQGNDPEQPCADRPVVLSTHGLTKQFGSLRAVDNLDLSHRLVFSEAVLLALIDRGMLREDAYRVVQESAMQAWRDGADFGRLVSQNAAVRAAGLTQADIDAAMDPQRHSAGREVIFERLAALDF